MPNVVIKEYFVNGLFKDLKLKVVCEMPRTFNEAMQVPYLKYQSQMYRLYKLEVPLPQRKYKSLKATIEGSSSKVIPKVEVKAPHAPQISTIVNHLMINATQEDVEFQGSQFPLKGFKVKEEGEGCMPILNNELQESKVCKRVSEGDAWVYKHNNTMPINKKKLQEVTIPDGDKQGLVCFVPGGSNDLEMVDASKLEW